MKKLFVSVPMKGRVQKDIEASIAKMKRIAEVYEEEPLELINSFVQEQPPENCNAAIWYLGKSLEKLALADVFIGVYDSYNWSGCRIESDAAIIYGIKRYQVDVDNILSTHEKAFGEVSEVFSIS